MKTRESPPIFGVDKSELQKLKHLKEECNGKDCKSLTNKLDDYIAARTRSKARLETNKAIMSKALEAGGDLSTSESLATAFLMLGITESSASALMTFGVKEAETIEKTCTTEPEPATYQAALQSPQAEKWKEAMRQEWQSLVENQTFETVEGNHKGISPNKLTDKIKSTEEPIGCDNQ
jgi:hypothetical protein